MKPIPAVSGRSPDLTVKQRSRDDVSSDAIPAGQLEKNPESTSVSLALDTGGSAPLPAVSTSTYLGGQPLLTADDVAAVLRVSRSLVYALARRGELPAIRIGERYIRFRAEAIERWIETQEAGETSSPPRRTIARIGGSPPTAHRGASGTSPRRRTNAPEPGIRRKGPDAS
jgi:excisionase family DNA binding protein